MKAFKSLFICCLVAIFPGLFGQEIIDKHAFDIHLMPFALLDETPRWRAGFEYQSRSKLGYALEIGYGNSVLNKGRLKQERFGNNYGFFEVRPELKYYLYESDYMDLYGSCELFYLKANDILENSSYFDDNTYKEVHFDQAIFDKNKFGAHIKGGIKLKARKIVSMDFYGGLGFGHSDIRYSDVINPVLSTNRYFEEMIPQFNLHAGERWLMHLTIGLKLGIVIQSQ